MSLPALFRQIQQHLFRWQSDGLQPIRLGQRRIFILPTAAGLQFAVLLVVMLLGAINYQLSLGHALVFLLAALGLVGMVHTFRSLYELEIRPGRVAPVHVGENARFRLLLRDTRGQARPQLQLVGPQARTVLCEIAANGTVDVEIDVAATHRGWLDLPRIRLESRYPLGLFRAWSYLQPSVRCLVYPKPLDTPLPESSGARSGHEGASESGDEDFSGLRKRQPADSLRHVAWKAAARDASDRPLLIKEFTGGGCSQLQLDWAFTDPTLTREGRLSQLCGWVLAADAAGHRYALSLPDGLGAQGELRTACAHGPAHRHDCLTQLALAHQELP